jgi:transposase, IS5 family
LKKLRDTLLHDVPSHVTSLTKWQKRIGADKLSEMLQKSLPIAVQSDHVTMSELALVHVDTTVQEKHITHPTDSSLYLTALIKMVPKAEIRDLPPGCRLELLRRAPQRPRES